MAHQLIENGGFAGFGGWNNGVGGGLAYTNHNGAEGKSLVNAITEQVYKICQSFQVNETTIAANITVAAAWQATNDTVDGYNQFIVQIVKPGGSTATLTNQTKTGVSGSGNLLSNYDIMSVINTQGTYTLWLTLRTGSARHSDSVSLGNDYTNWTKSGWWNAGSSELWGWSHTGSSTIYAGTATRSFTVGGPVASATLTVSAYGVKQGPECMAHLKVELIKPNGSSVILYNAEDGAGSYHNVLNNLNIAPHMTAAGTYKLKLTGTCQAYFSVPKLAWQESSVRFGSVNLSASWYVYGQSTGNYTSAGITWSCKKWKTVKENFGFGEMPKELGITKTEKLGFVESYSTKVAKFFFSTVLEYLGLKEFAQKLVKKYVMEKLGYKESYQAVRLRGNEIIAEKLGFVESLTWRRVKTCLDFLGFRENWFAEVTHGNITKHYSPKTETWQPVVPPTTAWLPTTPPTTAYTSVSQPETDWDENEKV